MTSTRLSIGLALALAGSLIDGAARADSGGPVKLGVLNDRSSVYSAITGDGSVAAAKMAIEDFGGSVLGKPIELVSADHLQKPDVGSAIARKWFDVEGVDAIFDIYSSGVALAVQKIAEDKDRILVISMASSRDISGKSCSTHGMQWANDGYAVANLTLKGASGAGPATWFFLTVDYVAGHSIEADAARMIKEGGGKFLGSVRFPLNTPDFSSFILQAQASGAKNVALIAGGADLTNAAKQANEFGLEKSGQRFVPLSMTTVDVYGLGNAMTHGMPLVLSYYWGESAEAQTFADRFKKLTGRMPTDPQANVYSATTHYLKAVKAAGTKDTAAVLKQMKETPVEDFFTHNAKIRADGRLMRSLYYAEAKAPEEMKGPDDLLKLVQKFAGEDSFIPAKDSECPNLKQ